MSEKTSKILLFAVILAVIYSCNAQNASPGDKNVVERPKSVPNIGDTVLSVEGSIRGIFQDSKNNMWFASDGDGVYKYDGKVITHITEKQGLCGDYAWDIQEGKDGKLWFKTRDAICLFDGATFKTIPVESTPFETEIYNDPADRVFVECYYTGTSLAQIKLPQTSSLKNAANARFHYDIYSALKDRKGALWFGTGTAGVCKVDGKTFSWLDDPDLGAPVRAIYEDRKGNIWIGNNGYGLLQYDGKTLTNLTKEYKLENPAFIKTFESKPGTLARVWSIAEDKEGNLWIASVDTGVWMFDGKTFTNYTTKDGLGTDNILKVFRDKNDKLWFGTDGFGVYNFDGKRFIAFAGGK